MPEMYPNKPPVEALSERYSSQYHPKEIVQNTGWKIEPAKAQKANGGRRGCR